MAKKKKPEERGARSKAVRDFLAANPKASPKVVVEELSKQGISVSLGLVSVIKYSKRGKMNRSARRGGRLSGSFDSLLHAKKFIDEVGGFEAAKEAISLVEKLS